MLFVFSLKSKVLAALDTSILAQREFLSHSEQGMAVQEVLFMYFFIVHVSLNRGWMKITSVTWYY